MVPRVESDPDPDDLELIDDGVRQAAADATGLGFERDLAVFAREDGQIRGGLYGWTWGDCCELQTMWVDPEARGEGLGARLVGLAEDEARSRGCTKVVIFAYTFQPHELYRGLGYEEVGRIEGFPTGTDAVWLLKRLDTAPDGPG